MTLTPSRTQNLHARLGACRRFQVPLRAGMTPQEDKNHTLSGHVDNYPTQGIIPFYKENSPCS